LVRKFYSYSPIWPFKKAKGALEQGTQFAIREGGRTVGAGKVVEIIE